MTEQSLNILLGPSSTQDSSLMVGVSKKNHTGQAKKSDQSFHPVLTDSIEDMEGELNQSLVPIGQRQNWVSLTGESKLFLEMSANRDSLIMDNKQVLSGKGGGELDSGEVVFLENVINHVSDSEAVSTPIQEDSLLHLLVSGRSQGTIADIELRGNPQDLAEISTETQNNNTVIPSSTEIPITQIKGSGVLSGPNLVSHIGSEGPIPFSSTDKHMDTTPNPNLPLPQNSLQRGVDGGVSPFTLIETDMLEEQTNQSNSKTQGLDSEQIVRSASTVTNMEKLVQGKQQALELLNTRAVKMGASLVSEDGAKSGVLEQSVLRSLNTISQESPNMKPSVMEGAGQKEKESDKTPSVSKIGQSLEGVSSTDSDSTNTLKRGEFATSTATGDSMITESKATTSREETHQNLAYIKPDFEPRIQSLGTSKEISVNSTSEALSADMTDHIAQRAKLFLQGGKSEVRLQLSPPELGNLKLEFTVVDDILEAKISVEKSMIKEIIEKDIPRIRELLTQADIDVGRLDVTLQEKDGARQDLMNQGSLSDAESKSDGTLSDGDKESVDEEEEEIEQSTVNSSSINYLV